MTRPFATLSTLFCGAHFGLFLAWVCTTMWGLDTADPRVAISAMQAMNASVRNATFAPFFFGTPIFLLISAALLYRSNAAKTAGLFALSGLLVLLGSVVLTMLVNVPMNEALAVLEVPTDIDAARTIWVEYSPDWQVWNLARTVASGLATLIALIGLQVIPRPSQIG